MTDESQHWQLIRQDDNGNRGVMATFTSEEGAIKAMEYYQQKGHKQTYWVEERDSGAEIEDEIERK